MSIKNSVSSFLVKILFLMLIGISFRDASAQNEKRLIKEAEDAERAGDNVTALRAYQQALDKNPQNAYVNYKLGVAYLKTEFKHRSLSYLQKALELNPKVSEDINKHLGLSYQINHEWDKAIEQFELCKKHLKAEHIFLQSVDRHIYECQNGKELMANPVDAKITNIGANINTKYPEFAPVISADESVLIFTSRREGSTGGQIDENSEFYEDIYISEKMPNGDWGTPKNMGKQINTEGHDASIGLSATGEELFTYDGNSGSGQGDIKFCKLKKKDSTWSKPYPMEGINTKASELSICISPDGSTIFFTSDREGGYGGLDIYRSVMNNNGHWGKPENLGSVINTGGNEDGVFLDFDGKTLHFSSQLHKGMGGYDIFKSVFDSTSKTWSLPENLGYPINTADNDIYFVLSGDGRHGYYASVREDGFGEKDIYMITMPPRHDYHHLVQKMEQLLKKEVKVEVVAAVKEEIKGEVKKEPVMIHGTVFDINSKTALVATVQLLDNQGNVLKEVKTETNGTYNFDVTSDVESKYMVTAQKETYGLVTGKVIVPASGPEKVELKRDLALGKLEVGAKFILRNIYYDFDKAVLKAGSVNELNKLLKLLQDNPTMKVVIGSHTDSKGSNDYNESLSDRRAMAVVTWLVNHGIDRKRLQYEGYGENIPIASNDDEEEGRELNRRTEFEVIGK